MFVSMVLDNVWAVYQAVLQDENSQQMNKIIQSLNLKVPPREMMGQDARGKLQVNICIFEDYRWSQIDVELGHDSSASVVLQAIFRKWLPVPNAVLGMVVKHLPSPIEAQKYA